MLSLFRVDSWSRGQENRFMAQQNKKGSQNRLAQIKENLNRQTVKHFFEYIRVCGIKGTAAYIHFRLNRKEKAYAPWLSAHEATVEELQTQRKTQFVYQPKISVVVPTYRTPLPFLRDMILSVQKQTYPNWELCIADGSEGDTELEAALKAYAAEDERICVKILDKILGISGNTNAAI